MGKVTMFYNYLLRVTLWDMSNNLNITVYVIYHCSHLYDVNNIQPLSMLAILFRRQFYIYVVLKELFVYQPMLQSC
jgi:hypothetical protein